MSKYIYPFLTILLPAILLLGCGQPGGNNPLGVTGGGSDGYGGSTSSIEDGGNGPGPSSIVGDWRYDEGDSYDEISFYANGTVSGDYYDAYYDEHYYYSGTYSVSGNELTMIIEGESFTMTFSVSANYLTLNYDGGSITYYRI